MQATNQEFVLTPLEERRLLAVAVAADLNRDTLGSGPSWAVSLGQTALYFAREPGKTTGGLWRTDGGNAADLLRPTRRQPRLV